MKTLSNDKLVPDLVHWSVHMERAISVSKNVISAAPNPRVGCVILCEDGQWVEGWHEAPGENHAEVMALKNAHAAGLSAKGSTVFVTLEPCAHQGRTGPCANVLVDAEVAKVVIACLDPNPKVAGKGVAILESAEVEVFQLTDFEARSRAVNPGFFKRFEKGLPYIRMKLAMSLDGRTALANGESQWITGSTARSDVQRLRLESSAVITGIGSVLKDDPSMNVRKKDMTLTERETVLNKILLEKQPLRVILDSGLRTPCDAKILGDGSVKIFTLANTAEIERYRLSVQDMGQLEVINCESTVKPGLKRVNLQSVLESLAQFDCNEVLIEAGPTLCGAFISASLVDEMIIYIAPKLLGANAKPLLDIGELTNLAAAPELKVDEVSQIGDDIKVVLRP